VIYALAARLFNRRVALITLGAAASVWWSILLGRVILREVLEIPLYGLALYAFWRGVGPAWHDRVVKIAPFMLGGLALGVVQYVHTIPRGLFIVFILFGIYLALTRRAGRPNRPSGLSAGMKRQWVCAGAACASRIQCSATEEEDNSSPWMPPITSTRRRA